MPLYNFQKRFADNVESGKKLQTIRRRRKRLTVAGEMLHLYTGLRSKFSRLLRRAKCTRVLPIEIYATPVEVVSRQFVQVKVGPEWISSEELDDFARADGFIDADDFYAFWRDVHGLRPDNPLKGFDLIQWEAK